MPSTTYDHQYGRFHGHVSPAHPGADPISHATEALRKIYGYSHLRAPQKEVLMEFLQGSDTLGIIPTGGGKSMCYVLPAMMGPGLGVVISPLIALIRDQVVSQRKAGIAAAAMDSLQSPEERSQVITALREHRVKLLYIAPERLARPAFRSFICELPLRFIAVDEAHCASEWGTDFRPEYRKLGAYFDELPASLPRLALTATATYEVRRDMIRFLRLRNPAQIIKAPLRSNLKIQTKILAKKSRHSDQIIKCLPGPTKQGILYTFSRKNCEKLASDLVKRGIVARPYHGGLGGVERGRTQRDFLDKRLHCVVATSAFGMGIDQKDIRFVHHYGLPTSLESYIQQIGRAGRDGASASCCLFYRDGDYSFHKRLIEASYPPLYLLHQCYCALEKLTKVKSKVSTELLYQEFIASGSFVAMDCFKRLLEILAKERFIQSFPQSYYGKPPSEVRWSLSAESSLSLEDFLQHYPKRKEWTLRRLKVMHSYAQAQTAKRDKLVQNYFVGSDAHDPIASQKKEK